MELWIWTVSNADSVTENKLLNIIYELSPRVAEIINSNGFCIQLTHWSPTSIGMFVKIIQANLELGGQSLQAHKVYLYVDIFGFISQRRSTGNTDGEFLIVPSIFPFEFDPQTYSLPSGIHISGPKVGFVELQNTKTI